VSSLESLQFLPVTPDRWGDLEQLFGPHGAYAGCWCMWWRLSRAEFGRQSGEQRKAGLRGLVDSGQVPGILAYLDGKPVAWVSVAPRETYPSLERSRTLKRVDDQPVWSIVCFFVAKPYRGLGLMVELLLGAVAYAAQRGAQIVEAYPVDPGGRAVHGNTEGYMGLVSAFRKAGFVEVARRSPRQAVMRYYLRENPGAQMQIEQIREATDEYVAALARLVPQLSTSVAPPTREEVEEMVTSPAIVHLIARDPERGGQIVGTLTLAMFRIPTGLRAWIEDVIVDDESRGKGIGEALVRAALEKAREAGARTVDLTSRPSREAANRLYLRVGFGRRDTNIYRYDLM
jgi:ribosomal protein S18 acetylase RimI-like enzyme